MGRYWIFVSVPYTDFNMGSIYEMFRRIRASGKWPIGRKTVHRYELLADDRVLFYQGGEGGRKIVGCAELASSLVRDENNVFDWVIIRNIELWGKPVEMKTVLEKLSFIKNRMHWGVYFQGGIIKIPERDYEVILRKAGTNYLKNTHKMK